MAKTAAAWRETKEAYLSKRDPDAVLVGSARETNYARVHGRMFVVLASSESQPSSWFFGLPKDYATSDPAALVLLCDGAKGLIDLGVARRRLDEIAALLKPDRTGRQYKLNVKRRRDTFVLQIPGRRDGERLSRADIVLTRDDRAAEPAPTYSVSSPEPNRRDGSVGAERSVGSFYARVAGGHLVPLDPVPWPDGTEILLSVSDIGPAPKVGVIRRIAALAAAAPKMPADLSTEHDHYAHGAPRRR